MRKFDLNIKFLNTCQNNDFCSTFVQYKISWTPLQNSSVYRQSQRLFIQEELTFKNFEQEKIILKIKFDLRTVINLIDWTHISRAFLESNIKAIKRVEGIQTYKLSELMGYKLQHDPKKVIHNFSSYQLSDTEKLLYYVKVWIVHYHRNDLNLKTVYYHITVLYQDVYDSDTKDDSLLHLKSEIKDVRLSSYRIYNKKDHRFGNLSQKEYDVFINLSDNKNTIIQKTDKGNTVVTIDWENYEKKNWKNTVRYQQSYWSFIQS